MKKNYKCFYFLSLVISLSLMSCSFSILSKQQKTSNIILQDTTHKIVCDTINAGFIKSTVIFEKFFKDTLTATFIITENYTFSIAGEYIIPNNVNTYIYIFNYDITTAQFTWDGDSILHKILK